MIIPIIGLIVGIFVGVFCPFVFPSGYSTYIAMGILACADSVLGGVKSNMTKNFKLSIFISGFFGNAALAIILVFLGEQLNIQLSVAAVVVFGSRLFQNFSEIRRFLLNNDEKKDSIRA